MYYPCYRALNKRISVAASLLYLALSGSALACDDKSTVSVLDKLDAVVDCTIDGSLKIAYNSFGESNFPLSLIRGQQVFEKKYPNLKVEWFDIRQSSDSRAALLAGQVDVITSSTTVFVQSWAKGVEYRVLTPITGYDGWLVTRADGPNSILDFVGTDMKISPGPGSTQYFAAQAALAKAGKDVNALQANWVQVQAPEAQQLLLNGSANELGATWDTDKWSLMNVDAGLKKIASYSETLPFPTSNVLVAMNAWQAEHPEIASAVAETVISVDGWVTDNPDVASELLVDFAKKQLNAQADVNLYKRMFAEKMLYPTTKDVKLKEVLSFMTDTIGVVRKETPAPAKDGWYFYPDKVGDAW